MTGFHTGRSCSSRLSTTVAHTSDSTRSSGTTATPHPARVLQPVGPRSGCACSERPAAARPPPRSRTERTRRPRPRRHHQLRREPALLDAEDTVEGALRQRGALLAQLAQEFRRRLGILGHELAQLPAHCFRHRGTAHPAGFPIRGIVGRLDRGSCAIHCTERNEMMRICCEISFVDSPDFAR